MIAGKVKKYVVVLLTASLIVNVVMFGVIVPDNNAFNIDPDVNGQITVKVVDAVSEQPLNGATVCIPEIEGYFTTGADGCTQKISVPIVRNIVFDNVVEQDWGQITLLVYKQGYVDFVIFYIMVREDFERIGPTISLYPTLTPSDNALHTLIESPDTVWAREVRDKYKK